MQNNFWSLISTLLMLLAAANLLTFLLWGRVARTIWVITAGLLITMIACAFPQEYKGLLTCIRAAADVAVYWLTLEMLLISLLGFLLGGPDGADFRNIPWTEHPFTAFLLTRLLLLSKSNGARYVETLRVQRADVLFSALLILQYLVFSVL